MFDEIQIQDTIKKLKERGLTQYSAELKVIAKCFLEMAKANNDTAVFSKIITFDQLMKLAVQDQDKLKEILASEIFTLAKLALVMNGTLELLRLNGIQATFEDIEAGCQTKKSGTTERPIELKPKQSKPTPKSKPSSFTP